MIDIKELPTDNELNSRLRVENSLSRSDGMVYGAIWMRDTYAKPLLEENAKLREQLQIAKEALDKNVKTIGNFMDRLSVEGIGNPDISTARLGTIEALHCFKRSRSALEQIERGNDE